MIDPRIISAVAFIVIGVAVCGFVIRVWNTHPINRVFVIGPYLTAAGQTVMLNNLSTGFAVGVAALVAGAAKIGYVARWFDHPVGVAANFLGSLEAVCAVWAACSVTLAVVRLCRKG